MEGAASEPGPDPMTPAPPSPCERDWSIVDHDDPVYGDAGIATAEEREQLDTMRTLCSEELRAYPRDFPEVVGDVRLLRFLRGHKTPQQASKFYRAHLRFRQARGLDAMREQIVAGGLEFADLPHFQTVVKYMPLSHEFSTARDGGPFSVQYNGRWDTVGLAEAVVKGEEITRDGFILCWTWCAELGSMRIDAASRKAGVMLRGTGVRDFRGVRLAQLSKEFISFVKVWVGEFQDNNPEMAGCEIFINTPAMFSVIWSFFSYFLTEGFKEKIQFFPEQSLEAQRLLFSRVSSRRVPVEFGGVARPVPGGDECTDCVLPVVRKRSSLRGYTGLPWKARDDLERHHHPRVYVAAGQFHELPIEMDKAGDAVSWNWQVESLNVHFSARFEPAGGKAIVAVPDTKVEAERAHVGRWTADGEGLLVLCWDNSGSWFNGKTITYGRIAFHSAGAEEEESLADRELEERMRLARVADAEDEEDVVPGSVSPAAASDS